MFCRKKAKHWLKRRLKVRLMLVVVWIKLREFGEKLRFCIGEFSKNIKNFIVCLNRKQISEAKMKIEELICAEVERLSKKFGKEFLELKDVMQITGLGRDKVREIFNSKNFPLSNYGHKQTVSIMAFVIWQMKNNTKGDLYKTDEEN